MPREEVFAMAVATGKTQVAALMDAGYNPTNEKSKGVMATQIMARERVKQRIAEIRERQLGKAEKMLDVFTKLAENESIEPKDRINAAKEFLNKVGFEQSQDKQHNTLKIGNLLQSLT